MKKDIAVIREAITKVVALLTKRSIKVTQRGSKAYVQYHAKTGAIQLVNLPYLPDDASDEFVAAVQGFLDHEVGHVLYTDPKIMPVLKKESAKVKNLANAIEDVYIERKMGEAFSGSVGNLNSVRRFYLDKIAKPKIAEALAMGDAKTAAAYAGLVQFRAWGGQQMASDFLRDNPEYAELVKPMAKRLGEDLIAKIKKSSSSWDCLDLARAMKKALEEPEEPEGEDTPDESDASAPSKKGDGSDSSSSSGSQDEPEDSPEEEGDKDEPEDKGSTRTETDDSGKERDKPSKTDEEVDPEAGNEGGGEDEMADQDEQDDQEGKDDKDDGGDPTDEDDRPDPSKDADDDLEEGDDPEGSEVGEDGSEEDGDEGAGEESAEGGDTDEAGDEAGDEVEESADEGAAEDSDDLKPEEQEDLSELFEKERDFDEEMSAELTKAAVTEIRESRYQIFSTDWDEIEPGRKAVRENSIEKMVDKTQHMVASIQKGLERAIAAKARKTWNPGQRRGRIAPGALFKTAVGDDRVFRTRYETQAKNTAVSLLVDCSGSMSWCSKIETAAMAAYALSSTLERLKITHEVLGFTTRINRAMKSAMTSEGLGVSYARHEALYLPVLKGFNERLTVDAKSRIAHLTEPECHDWLRENVDGESLQIAARRLKSQRAERHVLIVLSDGSPACSGDWRQLHHHLMDTAKKIDQEAGVEVIGIGILDNSVRTYYDKHVVLSDLSELPTTVVAELSKVLLAG